MSELDEIKMEALSLGVNDHTTMYCPFCDNERPWPKSLSVTRIETGILYNCYRASCSGSGIIGSLPSDFILSSEKLFKPNPFVDHTSVLSKDVIYHLSSSYYLSMRKMGEYNIREMTESKGDIVIPCLDSSGEQWGTTIKRFGTKAKAKHFIEREIASKLAWSLERPWNNNTLILVEDSLSMMRCSELRRSAALLGTNLTTEMVKDILKCGYRDVVLALDPDALSKAMDIKSKYSLFFNTFRVVSLSSDPKDLNQSNLKEELEL